MAEIDVNKHLDEILERLNYLQMVIRNLKDREGSIVSDVGEVDERLFREIASYELLTEEMKRDFVMLMMQDARKLANACISNISLFDKASESFSKIDSLLEFIRKSENEDIKKSKTLQDLTVKARNKLNEIRKEMENKVEEKKEETRKFDETQQMHRYVK